MHRSLDRWFACNPLALEADKLKQLEQEIRCEPGEGVRVRFVLPDLKRVSLLDHLEPIMKSLRQRVEFFHAELMEGPDSGLFVACDNRVPALLCQHWILDEQAEPTWDLQSEEPVHVNLLIHGKAGAISATLQQPLVRNVVRWLEQHRHPVHQITMALSDLHDRGISAGVEARLNESGSEGGQPAVG